MGRGGDEVVLLTLNFGKNLPGTNPTSKLLTSMKYCKRTLNLTLSSKDADDSDVSMQTLITALNRRIEDVPETVSFRKNGTLTSLTDTENADLEEEMVSQAGPNVENPQKAKSRTAPVEVGSGKRQKFATNGGILAAQ